MTGAGEDARWTEYWESGYLHSLNRVFEGNYGGAFKAFWDTVFDTLENGQRVLDIGTGNGAVALLAVGHARNRGLSPEVHAVDRADIDPRRTARERGGDLLDAIHFHPATPVEALPFDDASFDLFTGQYAYEYTELDAAARELYRVVKPGGRGALICHHDESIVMAGALRVQHFAGLVFDELEFLDKVEELLRRVAGARDDLPSLEMDPAAVAARDAFNDALAGVQRVYDDGPGTSFLQALVGRTQRLLEGAAHTPLADSLDSLARLRSELEMQRDRTADMSNCHSDGDGRARVLQSLRDAGFEVQGTDALHDTGPAGRVLVGWWVKLGR